MTFQAKLITKSEKYSVGETIIELNNDIDRDQLNHLVKNLLKKSDKISEKDQLKLEKKTFEFVIASRILRLSVDKHLELYSDEVEAQSLLNEKLIEIEYDLSLDSPKPLEAIPYEDWVSCVDANSSHIVSGSYDNSIRIFSITDRKELISLQNAHEKPVTKVRWLKNNEKSGKRNELYFVSCGHDEVGKLWSFNAKSLKLNVVFVYTGHNRSVNCVDSHDDIIATGSFDQSLRLWSANLDESNNGDVENGDDDGAKKKKQKIKSSDKTIGKTNRSAIMTLTGHQESVTGVRWLEKSNEFNTLATCSMDGTICFWDVEVGECKRRVLASKPLLGIDYSSENNLILAASCDRHVRIWDSRAPDNSTAKTVYTSHSAWVSSVTFGHNSNNFISGGYDNLVKLWDLRSPKASLYDLIGHHDKVLEVNWRNPSYVLSGSADSTLKVFASN